MKPTVIIVQASPHTLWSRSWYRRSMNSKANSASGYTAKYPPIDGSFGAASVVSTVVMNGKRIVVATGSNSWLNTCPGSI